jgi:lamin tail-like protein
MKIRSLIVAATLVAGSAVGVYAALPASAEATASNPCNVSGFYVNDDETADAPAFGFDGATFDSKDLIHHAAPSGGIDFPDMDKVKYGFEATGTADKLAFKMETSAPYSTIVAVPDGSGLWSTAMTYDQEGGQGHPVAKFTDLLGKPVKPGKVSFGDNSQVETFGVGYWTETGSALVTSISFHGANYPLSCKAPISIVQAKYNPSGTDAGTNLINEYVQIKNNASFPVNLNGYTVRNRALKIYTFGDVTIAGGAKIAVRTGAGTATATSVYQGSAVEIWKDADAATLRNAGNATLDACSWTKSASGLVNC